MHLVFALSGHQHNVEEAEKFLQTRLMNVPYTRDDGTKGSFIWQCQLRPLRLYEFIFPREYMDSVLKGFNLPDCKMQYTNASLYKLPFAAARKLMKLKPIPEPNKEAQPMITGIHDCHIIGIGIREDRDMKLNAPGEKDLVTFEGL